MFRSLAGIALLAASFAPARAALAAQKQPAAKPPGRAVLAERNARQMLLLMDTDKNGKISKEEWMTFMSAEFDRLDRDKSGELDPKELGASTMSFRHYQFANQGK